MVLFCMFSNYCTVCFWNLLLLSTLWVIHVNMYTSVFSFLLILSSAVSHLLLNPSTIYWVFNLLLYFLILEFLFDTFFVVSIPLINFSILSSVIECINQLKSVWKLQYLTLLWICVIVFFLLFFNHEVLFSAIPSKFW